MKVITLDKEIFEKAFELCSKVHTSAEIVQILQGEDDVEKQIAILQITDLSEDGLSDMLVSHLTGQDGPIREACAIKINEFFTKKSALLDEERYYPTYVEAVSDVNPNICRLVIDFLPCCKSQSLLFELLLKKIKNNYARIDEPDIEQKNFLTVRLFNLYWLLEAVSAILKPNESAVLSNDMKIVLHRAISYDDYTINEKVAKIVTHSVSTAEYFAEVWGSLRENQNFYVKRYFDVEK